MYNFIRFICICFLEWFSNRHTPSVHVLQLYCQIVCVPGLTMAVRYKIHVCPHTDRFGRHSECHQISSSRHMLVKDVPKIGCALYTLYIYIKLRKSTLCRSGTHVHVLHLPQTSVCVHVCMWPILITGLFTCNRSHCNYATKYRHTDYDPTLRDATRLLSLGVGLRRVVPCLMTKMHTRNSFLRLSDNAVLTSQTHYNN